MNIANVIIYYIAGEVVSQNDTENCCAFRFDLGGPGCTIGMSEKKVYNLLGILEDTNHLARVSSQSTTFVSWNEPRSVSIVLSYRPITLY